MKELSNKDKINLIKKQYKKEIQYAELILLDYDNYNIYITLNYNKKNDSYKLKWVDLDKIRDRNIERYISTTYIPNRSIELIKDDFAKFIVPSTYEENLIEEKDIVLLRVNIKTKEADHIDVKFKKYLPKSLAHLFDFIVFIFQNIPKKFEPFLYELLAKFTDTTERYEYKKEFEFNLFKGDIDKLFNYQIIQRGKKYYEESKILFLEKIEERYFAIVERTEKYIVVIKYNEEEEKMQVYCSCPCEFYCKHIYAVLVAIRNNELKRFYKIAYRNPEKNILDRIMEFNYSLCLGIIEQNFEIINNYGELELIPILDVNGNYNWEVLEDTEDEELTKQIKYFLDNNR